MGDVFLTYLACSMALSHARPLKQRLNADVQSLSLSRGDENLQLFILLENRAVLRCLDKLMAEVQDQKPKQRCAERLSGRKKKFLCGSGFSTTWLKTYHNVSVSYQSISPIINFFWFVLNISYLVSLHAVFILNQVFILFMRHNGKTLNCLGACYSTGCC